MVAQDTLLQEENSELVEVLLSDLPPNEELMSPEPTPALVRSIQNRGFEGALLLTLMPSGEYFVRAGNRRIKAVRKLAEDDIYPFNDPTYAIPAWLRRWTGPEDLIVSVLDNAVQKENPLQTMRAIMTLAKTMSEREIGAATGLKQAGVKRYMKLLRLKQPLLDGFFAGNISFSSASTLSGLTPSQQERAVAMLEEKGSLRAEDVRKIRQAVSRQSFDEFVQEEADFDDMRSWPVTQQGDTLVVAAPNGKKYSVSVEDFVAWLEEAE